jgi:hypothetical protein
MVSYSLIGLDEEGKFRLGIGAILGSPTREVPPLELHSKGSTIALPANNTHATKGLQG